jgi:sugar (pentulose or hexulose) kinase
MKDGILIGIDAGTSVIKSVAFTTTGEQIAAAAIPNRYRHFPMAAPSRTWRAPGPMPPRRSES